MTKLAYILAASHSGSTLLAMLLGAHPDTCTVGELKATNLGDVERYLCSCGTPLRRCGFWTRVHEEMDKRGIPFDIADARTDVRAAPTPYARRLLKPLHRGRLLECLRDAGLALSPAWRKHLARTQQRNAALADTVAAITGARVVIDSSKVALRLKYLLRNPGLDVRVIRLIRDGRAVALTYMDPARFADASDPSRRGGGTGRTREDERLSPADAAYEWRRSNEEAEHLLAGLERGRWMQVRYENVCTDTGNTLRRLFAFLGVGPDRAERDFRRVEHHVIGNGMRLDLTSEVRLDDRWRSMLTAEDLRTFDRVAGDLNRRYGYSEAVE